MSDMKNMIVLKDLPSNLIEEAFVVLKENNHKFPFSFSQFKKWRNTYIQEKRLEEEKESNQQELIYRNKRGYMV